LGHRQEEIAGLGGQILAAAVTATFSQQAFAASLGVSFPLLSDWDRVACTAYGVRYRSWKGHSGLAMRSVFVVDQNRRVRYRWVTPDAMVLPDHDEVIGVLASLRGSADGGDSK
jgi:peroxiredoxin